MLCEVIAYILSRQRLSSKTFVAGYFFMLCRIDCLCGCCATPPVSEPSHGFALRASPAVTHGVSPLGTVGAGWEISLFSPSPLSTLHGFSLRASPAVTHGVSPAGDSGCGLGDFSFLSLSTSPRVHPSGITRGYAWCVPSEDSGWTMSYFFSYQEIKLFGGVCFLLVLSLFVALKNTIRA